MHTLTGILLACLALSACASKAPAVSATSSKTSLVTPLIVLTKGPCLGTCPVYTLDIFADGRVQFMPRFFTLETDTAYTCWPLDEIRSAFESVEWNTLEERYMEPIFDIPQYSLRYRDKTVTWNARAPRVLFDLMTLLDRYTANEGWVEGRDQGSEDGSARPGELILQLKDPALWEDILQSQAQWGLILLRKLDPPGRYLLIGFEEERIPAEKLMALLRQHPGVAMVSRNREAQPRED
jgi:hypothetical protein